MAEVIRKHISLQSIEKKIELSIQKVKTGRFIAVIEGSIIIINHADFVTDIGREIFPEESYPFSSLTFIENTLLKDKLISYYKKILYH